VLLLSAKTTQINHLITATNIASPFCFFNFKKKSHQMEVNWIIISIVAIVVIVLVIFLIKRNAKDQKELEEFLGKSDFPTEDSELPED
jgi:uncharacterized integral membrane protein